MKTVELGGRQVPLMTIRDMLVVSSMAFEYERKTLLDDLDAAKADSVTRVDRLAELSRLKGTALLVLRATFRLESAEFIVRRIAMANGLDADMVIESMPIDQLCKKAAELAGYAPAEDTENPQ